MKKEEILQRIKDEVAIEYGWKNWSSAYGDNGTTNRLIDLVAERYGIAMCSLQKEECKNRVQYASMRHVATELIMTTKNVAE